LEEVRDLLDPEAYAERVRKSIFPGEPFRVLKEKELRLNCEYRTRRLVWKGGGNLGGREWLLHGIGYL